MEDVLMKRVDIKVAIICLLGAVLVHGSVCVQTSRSAEIRFIEPGQTWRFFRGTVPPSDPCDAWKEPDFNDLDWETGASGFGYGDGDDTTILNDMQGNYLTVYIRKEFAVSSVDANAVVELVIDYDDGFVAYLNGDRVTSKHMPEASVSYLTPATSHEAGTPEIIPLGTVGDLLDVNDGNNVLAIEGHNTSTGSTDFSLIPALRAVWESAIVLTEDTTWSGTVVLEDTVVVPAGVVLSVEPGTAVQMASGVSIKVYGQLLADGTEAQPISFTRYGAGTRWKQIIFIEAEDSRLAHCIVEFSNCAGDHKIHYDDDCNDATVRPSKPYFQAVVALASHLDIEGCTFQNLPDDGAGGEGDAIAIISDDPCYPGEASANIRNCDFISIGQGVHTRFAYVLVEDCFFTNHHGDNDDVDLYGESTPPPLIRNNLFLNPAHDDMINPTKCSAIITGNVIAGCDDHGVVLRDKCYPVVMNNLIYNCSTAGIAVQNQCDALIVNNTILNCGIGIRFFDHTDRWDPPYCLTPGSGKATIINCIIWDCPTSFDLDDSPYEGDRGSHATIINCDVEGGQGTASVSANSTLTWGPGNINQNPQFADLAGRDLHLRSQAGRWNPTAQTWVTDAVTSPCIDAGTAYVIDDPNYPLYAEIDYRGELWPHGGKINMGAYGGIVEASMSLNTAAGNLADVDYDGSVSLPDFGHLAQWWMMQEVLLAEDLDRNALVDLSDLLLMTQQWLWQELP
jgi:hypothetical protein